MNPPFFFADVRWCSHLNLIIQFEDVPAMFVFVVFVPAPPDPNGPNGPRQRPRRWSLPHFEQSFSGRRESPVSNAKLATWASAQSGLSPACGDKTCHGTMCKWVCVKIGHTLKMAIVYGTWSFISWFGSTLLLDKPKLQCIWTDLQNLENLETVTCSELICESVSAGVNISASSWLETR